MADEKQQNIFDGDQPEGEAEENELAEDDAENGQGAGEGCEPEEGCEDPDAAAGTGKGKGKNGGANKTRESKAAPVTPAPNPAPATTSNNKFKYPFHVRYATEFLDLAGFADGTEYTGDQVKEILIANGYTEFADMAPAFHRSEATNTIVITIQGSKKGHAHG